MSVPKRILVIDDERRMADSICQILIREGYHAVAAHGGREGLELVRRDNVDVAIIDVNMPDMDGVELAGQIAELPKPIPTILISSDDSTENADRCRALGGGMFLAKPLDPEVLLETVSRMLATRS